MKDHSLLCLAVNSKKPPKLLCHHPQDLNPPQLLIKNPPPLCECTYPCASYLHMGSWCILCSMDSGSTFSPPWHRLIIFHVSTCTGTGTGTGTGIGTTFDQAISQCFPPLPFALCPFAFSSFFNPDNGNCCILQCHGWPKPCHSSIAGDCKKSPANQDSSQITSDNIG